MNNEELITHLRCQVKVLEEKVKRLENVVEDLIPDRPCLATGMNVSKLYCKNSSTFMCKHCNFYMKERSK